MSYYRFVSVTVPRMCPSNPRLNFRVAYCLKLSGNRPLLYMKVMKVTKWQLKSRKLWTIVSILIAIETLLNHPEGLYASGSSHCDRHTKILIHYKNTDKWTILRNGKEEGSKPRNLFDMFYFYDFRSESVCKVKTVWAGDHVVWSRISSILLLFIFLHGWKMVYFRNLLCTLPLPIGCHFSRLTVRYLSEGGAYQNFFFANYKAVRDIFLFLCLFKNDHKSTEKMEFLIKVSF